MVNLMNTKDPLKTLQSYVSDPVVRRLAAGAQPALAPAYDAWEAAGLLVDISGFTSLAENLAARGPVGAELLSRILNRYFDQMIAIVTAQGGQIVQFIGDALIVIWPPTDTHSLVDAVHQGLHCALQLKQALNGYEVQPGQKLYLKSIVGAGPVRSTSVGGRHNRWQYLITGPPVAQISRAARWAEPGHVVVSPEAWAMVRNVAEGAILADGCARLRQIAPPRPWPPTPPVTLPGDAEPMLRRYVSTFVQNNLKASQHGWLAELRRLTILFLNIQIDYHRPEALHTLQRAVTASQEVLYRYEGHWTRIVVDEKGTYLLMVLGLPPYTHENDPWRGVQIGLALNPIFAGMGIHGALGITTGRVFCGEQGNDTRREYTFLGDGVNLSARLMVAAESEQTEPGLSLLCDEKTYLETQALIRYQSLPPLAIKGRTTPTPVYQPLAPIRAALSSRQELAAHWPLLGREAELAFLRARLKALQVEAEDSIVIVEGEAGIGKSHLADVVLADAVQRQITCWYTAADAVEKNTPYHAWRPLFAQLLALEQEERWDNAAMQAHLETQLSSRPQLLPLLPLLNPVIPVELPDTAVTAQMALENRADNTQALLVTLLQQHSRPGHSHFLLVEDVQWFDSASWELLLAVRHQIRPLLLLLTGRSLATLNGSLPEEARQLLAATPYHLHLEPLTPEPSLELVRQRLGVRDLPRSVADLIQRTAEGHPFFSEEIAYALRDTGHIQIENGRCQVAPEAGNLASIQFPTTIEGVITARIARLTPEQQLTVKVASVIGRIFALRALTHIYPIPAERDLVPQYVSDLDRLNITPYYASDPEVNYIFRHILSREVAYNLMLYAQRQQLHQTVAEWYEAAHAANLAPIYPLLAYHWHEAAVLDAANDQVAAKAVEYLDKAGVQALRNGAMNEAAQFFSRLLHLLPQIPVGAPIHQMITPLQQGRWQRQMGEALMRAGRQHEAFPHLEEALRHLGFHVPQSSTSMVLRVVGLYGRQVLHRLAPGRFLNSRPAQAGRLLEAAYVYDLLAEAWYLVNDPVCATYYSICRTNTAELAPPSPHLAAYASVCMTMSLIGLKSFADGYARLALRAAAEMDDLSTKGLAMLRVASHYLAYCRWDEALHLAGQIDAICEQVNDWQVWATNKALLAPTTRYSGDFARSLAAAQEGQALARRSGNRIHETWGILNEAVARQAMGDTAVAAERLEALLELLKLAPTLTVELTAYGALALAYWHQGKPAPAKEMADKGLVLFAQVMPVAFFTLPGYGGVTETYLRLLAANPHDADLQAKAKQAMKAFKAFARGFPFARPYLHLCQGLAAWQAGKGAKAFHWWQKGIDLAAEQQMPYEKGMLLVEYGRHLPPHDPWQAKMQAEAAALFAELNCRYELPPRQPS